MPTEEALSCPENVTCRFVNANTLCFFGGGVALGLERNRGQGEAESRWLRAAVTRCCRAAGFELEQKRNANGLRALSVETSSLAGYGEYFGAQRTITFVRWLHSIDFVQIFCGRRPCCLPAR